jgi:hypothetical protein
MTTPHHRPLWQRLFRSAAQAPAYDAADMGTAIGLDFVLDQQPLPTLVAAPLRRAPSESVQAPRVYD